MLIKAKLQSLTLIYVQSVGTLGMSNSLLQESTNARNI